MRTAVLYMYIYIYIYVYMSLRPSKPLRPSPMDDKLVVTTPKDLPLSSSEMSIMKQGLSFIPTPHNVDEFEICCDFEKFCPLR